jgi:hypothetical protein
MKNFTTDLATYEIKTVTDRRVVEFVGNAPVWGETTTYRIFRDGKLLTVCYDEADIAGVIDCQERPERYTGMTHRLD